MNKMINIENISMATVEIAKLTGKEHFHVMRDVRTLLAELYGEKDVSRFGCIYSDTYGREKPCYRLPKREILILVSGYSIPLRAAIIDRLEELEKSVVPKKQQPTPDIMTSLNDPGILRKTLLTYTEKVIALEATVKIQAPKVKALDRLVGGDGSRCITNAAKSIKVQPKILFKWLEANKWIYRRAGGRTGYIAYQNRIQQGVLEHSISTYHNNKTGEDKVSEQVLVTPKGLANLPKLMENILPKRDSEMF